VLCPVERNIDKEAKKRKSVLGKEDSLVYYFDFQNIEHWLYNFKA
jgi:hypothetical protein